MPLHIPSPSHCFYTNDRPLSISGCAVLVSSSDGPWSQLVQGFNQEVLPWTSSFWLGCKMIHPQVGKYRFPYLNFLKYEPALYLNRKLCQSFTLKNRSLSIGWSVLSLCIWISIHIKVKILITHIAHMRNSFSEVNSSLCFIIKTCLPLSDTCVFGFYIQVEQVWFPVSVHL